MAELTIRLHCRTTAGRQEVRISFQSDEDVLPHEHELMHRSLILGLFPGLDLEALETGRLVVKRERPSREPVLS